MKQRITQRTQRERMQRRKGKMKKICMSFFLNSCILALIRLSRRSAAKTDGYNYSGLSELGIEC